MSVTLYTLSSSETLTQPSQVPPVFLHVNPSPFQPMAVTMLEWCGCPKEGCIGVGVGSMCPEWLKGGRWPMDMCPARELKGELLSCRLLVNSS